MCQSLIRNVMTIISLLTKSCKLFQSSLVQISNSIISSASSICCQRTKSERLWGPEFIETIEPNHQNTNFPFQNVSTYKVSPLLFLTLALMYDETGYVIMLSGYLCLSCLLSVSKELGLWIKGLSGGRWALNGRLTTSCRGLIHLFSASLNSS